MTSSGVSFSRQQQLQLEAQQQAHGPLISQRSFHRTPGVSRQSSQLSQRTVLQAASLASLVSPSRAWQVIDSANEATEAGMLQPLQPDSEPPLQPDGEPPLQPLQPDGEMPLQPDGATALALLHDGAPLQPLLQPEVSAAVASALAVNEPAAATAAGRSAGEEESMDDSAAATAARSAAAEEPSTDESAASVAAATALRLAAVEAASADDCTAAAATASRRAAAEESSTDDCATAAAAVATALKHHRARTLDNVRPWAGRQQPVRAVPCCAVLVLCCVPAMLHRAGKP